jgi:hypothetical protein
MRRRQEGQALVAAMVVMLILFALAGAVAIGATTLLSSQRDQGGTFRDDLTVQSAVSDAVARVAGSQTRCGPAQPALSIDLPEQDNPASSDPSFALCVRADDVQPDTIRTTALNWARDGAPGLGSAPWLCITVQLPGNGIAIAFDARWTLGGYAYVDGQGLTSCNPQPPPPGPTVPCQRSFPGSTTPVQMVLSCQFSTFGPSDHAYLHIRSAEQAPARVFTAHQATNSGSMYLLAARTGLPRPDYEEAVVHVDPTGATRLAYEGRLP